MNPQIQRSDTNLSKNLDKSSSLGGIESSNASSGLNAGTKSDASESIVHSTVTGLKASVGKVGSLMKAWPYVTVGIGAIAGYFAVSALLPSKSKAKTVKATLKKAKASR